MEKYIKELLFEHDCVIVPGLGGFLTQYISADIHPITHKFTPPAKRVAFNEQLQSNDGLLVTVVSQAENISRPEAARLVNDFVKKVKESIEKINLFELSEIGRLFYNKHNKLEFEPETSINYFEESYGLSELFFKPIERNFTTMNKPSTTEKPLTKQDKKYTEPIEDKPASNTALIVFSILFLVFSGATAIFYLNQDNEDLASINPFVIFGDKKEVVETPKPAPVAVEEPAPVTEEPETSEISSTSGRFFVIAGSFKNRDNAYKLKEKFESENKTVSIIEPTGDKNFYRVAIADFDSKETAKASLKNLKASYGKSLWILSN